MNTGQDCPVLGIFIDQVQLNVRLKFLSGKQSSSSLPLLVHCCVSQQGSLQLLTQNVKNTLTLKADMCHVFFSDTINGCLNDAL